MKSKTNINENNEFELIYVIFRVYRESYKGDRFKFENKLGEFELKKILKKSENNIDRFDRLIVQNENHTDNNYLKSFKLEYKKENIEFLDKII